MKRTLENRIIFLFFLVSLILSACAAAPTPPASTAAATFAPTPTPPLDMAKYAFPTAIDPAQRYLFYLHGKIIEDQGLPAVSPDYGEYEYAAILNRFSEAGFMVIAELRPKNADGYAYARKIAGQIKQLLDAGVPAHHITVAGASKGSYIAIAISNLSKNEELNFVLLGSCAADEVTRLIQDRTVLYGNILSIYDSVDEYSGSCSDLFAFSEGKGFTRRNEIVLHMGTGHGILYKPLDEWMLPTVEWGK
ncbi:MAG: hypothetical protein JW908_11345 [Anaerolineales bacterium]|nr:hypothetical protein [Anaerolineales bacterium]